MDEPDLLHAGRLLLEGLLGAGFELVPYGGEHHEARLARDAGVDEVVAVHDLQGGYSAAVLIEARERVTPAVVRDVIGPRAALVRRLQVGTSLLVIAPWLSQRTRAALDDVGCSYLDLTGNVRVDLDRPRVLLRTTGEQRDPSTRAGSSTLPSLGAPRAGRLVRLLVDFRPPLRSKELAAAAQISPAYVSRLLDTLDQQALIERQRGTVNDVDWVALLRARADETRLLQLNPPITLLATAGPRTALEHLGGRPAGDDVAVTGAYAAAQVVHRGLGGSLMLYVASSKVADEIGDELGLLPVEGGADVLLLPARDRVVFDRTRRVGRVAHVALSQLVIDCLSGPERLPAEGEAILEYMQQEESVWRCAKLPTDATA